MNETLLFAGLSTTPMELVSFILAMTTVWLTIRQNHWAWLFTMISSLTYAAVFFHSRLYGDMGLQFVFVVAAAWGWYQWLYGGNIDEGLRVSRLPPAGLLVCCAGWLLGFALLALFLRAFTNTDVPAADGFLTAGSLLGTLLLSRKKIENWKVWIVVDLLYVGLYAYKQLWLTAVLYALFVYMALCGLRAWRQDLDLDGLVPVDLRRL
jgi:nicotinamide mononucleotide transporter